MNALSHPKFIPDSALKRGDFSVYLSRDTVFDDIDGQLADRGGLLLCVTVYNEAASALACSLAGLAQSVIRLRQQYPDIAVTVCVLVDGIERSAPSMMAALPQLVGPDQLLLSGLHDLSCHYREVDLCKLPAFQPAVEPSGDERHWQQARSAAQALGPDPLTGPGAEAGVHLLLALKRENRGKLDSHWWFYRVFCPQLVPDYCFQMDVGTVPTAHALRHLVDGFERDSNLGAVASNILPPAPGRCTDLLQCWQYISFSNSMLLEWPAESAAGYLSVIPGQLSAVRWKAIAVQDNRASKGGNADALDVYFKGLGPLSPHDSMLYLAEDRVLCREIVSDPDTQWTISQIDDAVAITDPCHSWGELLRQRKRWCNGYLACRVNYLRKLPGLIANPAVAVHRKVRAASASIYHAIVLANDWCTLAAYISLLTCLTQNSQSLVESLPLAHQGLTILAGAAFAALLAQFALCYHGKLSPGTIRFFRFSIALQAGVVMVALAINLVLGETIAYALLLLILYMAAPLASLIGHRRISTTIITRMPVVFATMYVVPLLMWMYAICNVHDSSWGTKGLTLSVKNRATAPAAESVQDNPFTGYRKRFVLLWVGSNLFLAGLVYWWSRATGYDVAIIVLAMTSVLALFGLACRAAATLGRRPRFAATNIRPLHAESTNHPLDEFSHREPGRTGAMERH